MKRFYSTIAMAIMMLVSFTVSAQVKSVERSVVGAESLKGTLTRVGDAQKQERAINIMRNQLNTAVAGLSATSSPKKAPAKAVSETWTSLGQGSFDDTFMGDGAVSVEVQQNDGEPTLYRLVNPYAEITGGYEEDPYLYMQILGVGDEINEGESLTQDGLILFYGQSSYSSFNTGFYNTTYSDYVCLCHPAIFIDTAKEEIYAYSHVTAYYDDNSPRTIKLSPFYYMFSVGGWNKTTAETIEITMPAPAGVEVKDYSIALETVSCAADNKVNFTITAGEDVSVIKFGIFKGNIQGSASNYAYVAANGNDIAAGSWSYTLNNAAAGRYAVIAVTLDENGDAAEGAVDLVYIIDDDEENWTSLGNTLWGENIVAGYYTDMEVEDIEVEIQKNVNTPGYYRLVNPYANWSYLSYSVHDSDHNHYLYINAEDPEKVFIEESPLGIDFGDGTLIVNSLANNFGDSYKTSDYYGTLVDGVISFPAKAIVVAEQHYKGAAWYLTNSAAGFYVQIPGQTVVKVEDAIDFKNGDYAMSSNGVTDGDITDNKVFESVQQQFTLTVTPATGSTPNRVWSNGGNPQLRVYSGVMTIQAADGMALKNVVISGASGNWNRDANYLANGLKASEIASVEGNSVAVGKLTWNGNSTNLVIEVYAQVRVDDIQITLYEKDDETTTYTISGTPDAITSVSAAKNEVVYNLNGQVVKNAQRGLYIINGKKIVK